MPDRSPKPTPRRRRSPRGLRRPAASMTAAQSLWDACVIWELGEGLSLATLGTRGIA